jgi:hypothetical protein
MKRANMMLRWIAGMLAVIMILTMAVFIFRGQSAQKPAASESSASTSQTSASSTTGSTATTGTTTSQPTAVTTSETTRATTADPLARRMQALESLIVNPFEDPLAGLNEQLQLEQIDFSNRYFRPVWRPKLTLYASTSPGQPDNLPSQDTPVEKEPYAGPARTLYSSAPYAAVIPDSDNQVHWFAISLTEDVAAQTTKILWQVSLLPFNGSAGTGGPVTGLLLSGELDRSAREFSIDFAKVSLAEKRLKPSSGGGSFTSILPNLPNTIIFSSDQHLRQYYVRAFPVGSRGRSIGDTGSGLPVLYGQPVTRQTAPVAADKFQLLSTRFQGKPTYNGEFPNSLDNDDVRAISTAEGKVYYVQPEGYDSRTTTLVLQVSREPYPVSLGNWASPAGLVYEQRLHHGEELFTKLGQPRNPLPVDFSLFAPQDSELPAKEALPYYIRFVALAPGPSAGTATVLQTSKTLQINYGLPQPSTTKFLPEIKISANLPQITKVSYTPVDFETPGWYYRYIVFRQPTITEVFGPMVPSDDLVPNLAVGTKIDFTPQPEADKSWWEEAWEAISDFFTKIADFFASLVNWVSDTYAGLKEKLIDFVVSKMTFLSEAWQEKLKEALRYTIDYGLASIGLPPSLPNFNQLTGLGVDYLATVAMEKAGIPASEIITNGVADLAGAIRDSADESAQTASPNPMGWNFIKLDPDCLYTPAYVLIKIQNPSSVPTPEGYLSGSVDRVLDTQTELADPDKMTMYAKFGGNCYYSLFKPVAGQKVPSLAPGQTLVIPVFLEEYVGLPYYTNGPVADRDDFKRLYWGFGSFEFNFTISYQLPNPGEAAKKQPNYQQDAIYSYQSIASSISYKGEPYKSWSR